MYMYCTFKITCNIVIVLYFHCVAVDGKRSPGITAVWVARNKFAVLDKSHQVL